MAKYIPGAGLVLIIVAAAAAGLSLTIYRGYQDDMRRVRDRIIAASQIVETPCGAIEYTDTGVGAPLLIVHGAGGGFDQGQDLAGPLAENGFRVIAMSRFGYLRTPLPADASAARQADAHACLLDALNIPRAAIMGVSAGGPSTLQFALRHPERCAAMILLVPAAYAPRADGAPSVNSPQATQFVFDTALKSDFLFWLATKAAHRLLIRAILGTPPEVVEAADAVEQARVSAMLDNILPVTQRRLGLINDGAVVSTLPRYELERIAVPTLAISVADDLYGTFDTAKYTAEHIPGARFVGYPGGGHVLVGRQKEAMSEIKTFLRAN